MDRNIIYRIQKQLILMEIWRISVRYASNPRMFHLNGPFAHHISLLLLETSSMGIVV